MFAIKFTVFRAYFDINQGGRGLGFRTYILDNQIIIVFYFRSLGFVDKNL